MTYEQLKNSVIRLGFESGLDDEGVYAPAFRRALHTVYIDRPVTRTVRISAPARTGNLIKDTLNHVAGKTERFPLSGIAYSFRVSGKGRYTVSSASQSYTEEFDTTMADVKGFCTSGSVIRFEGGYSYTVYSLAEFTSVGGHTTSDIPMWDEGMSIDLGRIYGDYLAPELPPMDKYGYPIAGAAVREGVLSVPEGYAGEVILTYRRLPRASSGEDPEELIDVAPECEELLPLLVAAYLWLDDEPDKAQYYMSLYKDGISTLRRFFPRYTGAEYRTNGWA